MLLRRTCKQVCALLIAREDKPMAVPDMVAVKLHLLACKMCPDFEQQVLTMRSSLKRWRNYSSDALQ
jgi:hypothetical protein